MKKVGIFCVFHNNASTGTFTFKNNFFFLENTFFKIIEIINKHNLKS